jgi:HTH-type transcriptional regulator, cell division transcriptional repressor
LDNRVDLNGISARLKQIRRRLNLVPSQVFLKTGISTGNLSELENGKYLPSTKTLILLSELYQISVDWILKGTPSNKDIPIFENPLPSFPNNEMMIFFHKLSELWAQEDRDIQGWMVVQMRLAFPQVSVEIKRELEIAAISEKK